MPKTTKKTRALPKLYPMAKQLRDLLRKRESIDEDIQDIVLKLQSRAQQADALGNLTVTIEREDEAPA